MKKLLLAALLFPSLASCSKKNPDPTPKLTGGTWSLETQSVLYTPKNGGVATTHPRSIQPGTNKFSYGTDGKVTIVSFGVQSVAAYTFTSPTITIPQSAGSQGYVFTVLELSAHKLVTMETREDTDNRYDDTVTYSR
jgi:hypothetical protein